MANFGLSNLTKNLKSAGNALDTAWDAAYEGGRELGSRAFNNNAYNANNPSAANYGSKTQGVVQGLMDTSPSVAPEDKNKSGAYDTGSGGGGGNDYSMELGQIADQEGLLRQLLGTIGTKRDQGFKQIDDSYNANLSNANDQQSRALRDFNTKQTDTEMGREQAIGKVDTNARTLADSLRRMLGMAAGSGSSAYQITAPDAVARKASLERGDVQEDFGRNFRDLSVARKDTEDDYTKLLRELDTQRNAARSNLEGGLNDQEIQANSELANLARQRTGIQGGNLAQVRAASAPYQDTISAKQAAIDSLFEKYRTPAPARDLKVQDVNLRDYVVDRANIGGGSDQQTVAASPYVDPFRQKKDDEQNPLY